MGLAELFKPESVALTTMVLCVVAASGLALGSVAVKGVKLGIPGVMFTGLVVGHVLPRGQLNDAVVAFIRDFGLILFVYAVGVQVGPGFIASLRKRGLPMNLMAAAVVLLGAALAVVCTMLKLVDINGAVGLFAGATTNAPALGSATETIKSLDGAGANLAASTLTLPAFAIAYPFGLVGVILAMVVLRAVFRVRPQEEAERLERAAREESRPLSTLNIELRNSNLDGLRLQEVPGIKHSAVVVSRILHQGAVVLARPDLTVTLGDVLLAVGPPEDLEDLRKIAGVESKTDLRAVPSRITTRQVVVTTTAHLGKSVTELDLPRRLGVTVTRVSRAEIELSAVESLRLQFGDRLRLVGETAALDQAAAELGNSVRELNLPRLPPVFVGIGLGVLLGSIPIFLPGLPVPVRLGLASGPLIVAIILARIGRVGPLIWYMPYNATAMLRELGIVLFLVSVGLQAADGFFAALHSPLGARLLVLGMVITLVPILVVGLAARVFLKLNYLHICGLLAGSMTSPSLPFTQTMTPSEEPAVAFATVYPLTMILRVLVAQLLVLLFR